MRFSSRQNKNKNNLRLLAILAIIGGLMILVVGLVLADYRNVIDLPFFKDKSITPVPAATDTINYAPPTDQEKKETEAFKEQKSRQQQTTPTAPSGGNLKNVKPVITSWPSGAQKTDIVISGYVPDVVEYSGTCTVVMSKGSSTVTKSGAATQNVQNMSCGWITIEHSKLSTGTWNTVLSYQSNVVKGSSSPINIEVQ